MHRVVVALACLLLGLTCPPAQSAGRERSARLAMLWPARLQAGDTIAVVAPAGPPERDQVMLAKQRIEERGYDVRFDDDMFSVEGYLAGSDERRAKELMDAFADPEVDGILCARGGYGAMRILDDLDYQKIRDNPKPLVGFSDITALHAALNRHAGLVTFHGPGPASGLGKPEAPTDFTVNCLIKALEQGAVPESGVYDIEVPEDVRKVTAFGAGKARGRLEGGNLSLVSALEGTPYAIDADGAILLIEDVNEAAYRVDRMLRQLKLAGKLGQIKGAVLGQFTDSTIREDKLTDDPKFSVNGVLNQYFENAGIPVLMNYPVGHFKHNATVPLGGMAEVDADARTLHVLGPDAEPK
jgi:muramoyltetrapeptide carboxypeptidase